MFIHTIYSCGVVLSSIFPLVSAAQGTFQSPQNKWTTFPHPISRVAVIGAGPAGLQAAASLLSVNLSVHLFERAPAPGGNCRNSPQDHAGKPDHLPATIYYEEGQDGLSLSDRWKRHWQPRPVWYDLHTNSPKVITELPDVRYPADTPWSVSVHEVQRHVRAYASLHGLNSNDEPSSAESPRIVSYSTLVEKAEKCNVTSTWVLTLRRLEWIPGSRRMKMESWIENFDALVVAVGRFSNPYVPEIEGIQDWSKAKEGGRYSIQYSQSFRHPDIYSNKTVLIVGASVSATQIAQRISPFVRRLIVSVRRSEFMIGLGLDILSLFPDNAELVPEIKAFEALREYDNGIKNGKLHLFNGTVVEGIDEIILATGYRRNTFNLPNQVNPKELDDVHWTGHYIHDPTLAFMSGRAWSHGRYQSYGFAKVWTGKARLPSHSKMWDDYVNKVYQFGEYLNIFPQQAWTRQFVAWLNSESLVLGGKFVDPPPEESREVFSYSWNAHWNKKLLSHENWTDFDNIPSSEWPKAGEKLTNQLLETWWDY
ncbi:FAD/NAD-P-binding domain-containing protein [Mycena rebaudengoi]|nr:FAD/NAD-P-binding domain-containing protein [Mycena rebaudengoi]